MPQEVDLLNPIDTFRDNYIYQMRQTIDVYLKSMIVIGEALQNSIDAICENPEINKGKIDVKIDFDANTVSIKDNGTGFPRRVSLLYLGGTDKARKRLKGRIGVGIKVALFSSNYFQIKSRTLDSSWSLEIADSHKFEELQGLKIPDPLLDDPDPLDEQGTYIKYGFPLNENHETLLDTFVREVTDATSIKDSPAFRKTVAEIIENSRHDEFPSVFAALLSAYMRRFSYLGDVLAAIKHQEKYPKDGIEVVFSIKCSEPTNRFGKEIGELFGGVAEQSFSIVPSYLRVEDTLALISSGKFKPIVFEEKLGPGGSLLEQSSGFNIVKLETPEEYELLLINAKNQPSKNLDFYRRKLFPYINGILVTIGRIPDFEKYLPSGSRRVISCNGVITSHDIDLTRGRNQQYVRCFDLVIDLDARLNYGKTQLTNMHLVKDVRDYINEAYASVIQNAAGKWVGRLPDDDDENSDDFLGREDLDLPEFAFRKVPRDENDVIALFMEILGRQFLSGYQIYGLSQKDRYDCRAAIKRESDDNSIFEPTDDSKLRVVEFKLHASEVIRNFDRSEKFPRELDLVIAWDQGNYQSRKYAIYDIDQSNAFRASPKKVFPGVTKYIYDAKSGREVQVLLLKELVPQIKNDESTFARIKFLDSQQGQLF